MARLSDRPYQRECSGYERVRAPVHKVGARTSFQPQWFVIACCGFTLRDGRETLRSHCKRHLHPEGRAQPPSGHGLGFGRVGDDDGHAKKLVGHALERLLLDIDTSRAHPRRQVLAF